MGKTIPEMSIICWLLKRICISVFDVYLGHINGDHHKNNNKICLTLVVI